jgi:hypothetical protein
MARPKLLIEQWLPIEAIGAECMRERGARASALVSGRTRDFPERICSTGTGKITK